MGSGYDPMRHLPVRSRKPHIPTTRSRIRRVKRWDITGCGTEPPCSDRPTGFPSYLPETDPAYTIPSRIHRVRLNMPPLKGMKPTSKTSSPSRLQTSVRKLPATRRCADQAQLQVRCHRFEASRFMLKDGCKVTSRSPKQAPAMSIAFSSLHLRLGSSDKRPVLV